MARGKRARARAAREAAATAPQPRKRDYRAEYQRRLELGRQRGETVAESRGHRAEGRRRVGASAELAPARTPGYLDRLAARRTVRVMGYTADGRAVVVAQGKAHAAAAWLREQLAEGSFGQGRYPEDEIEMVRIFFE